MRPPACVVLAGGLGTRLRSAVPDRPKCLAPVNGRPFLALQLQALARQGVGRFVLSLGHMADMVQAAVPGFGLSVPVQCVVEDAPLGTGGAVLHALHVAGIEEALVANGDTFIAASLAPMLLPLGHAAGERARMAVMAVPDRSRYGGVDVQAGVVRAFTEKGQQGPGLINAGLYRLHLSAFGGLRPGQSFSMEGQVMPALLPGQALHAALLQGEFTDIGVPADYHRFCASPPAA